MNRKLILSILVLTLAVVSACNSGYTRRNPGKTFVPDMTYSRAYDAYTYNPVTGDSLTSQLPVPGTIARGKALPDHLTIEDSLKYDALKNPYTFGDNDIEHGKRLYNIQCGICHGTDLNGDGPLYNGGEGKYAAKPASFNDPAIKGMTDGRYYYTIMYGKNMMGSYASQLTHEERWKVIAYIRSKNGDNAGATSQTAPVDASATETTTAAVQ